MVRKSLILLTVGVLLIPIVIVPDAGAGARIRIGDDSSIDLGMRLQAFFVSTDEDVDPDPGFEGKNFFEVRRARFRIIADITDRIGAFLQTEISDREKNDVLLIDAFGLLKTHRWLNIFIGQHMAPVTRQNMTGSASLLAIDRPGISGKVLTWGAQGNKQFSIDSLEGSGGGLGSSAGSTNRDRGITLFGSGPISDRNISLKYYISAFDGSDRQPLTGTDSERFTGRIQINVFDPEQEPYNQATYLGRKKTIGIGAAYDFQRNVTVATDSIGTILGNVDYAFYTFDYFAELPVGNGSMTFEAAYENLDLEDAPGMPLEVGSGNLIDFSSPENFVDARQVQGDGFYVQLGYYIKNYQPWVAFEQWDSDLGSEGSFNVYRAGLSYFIRGYNANVKIGYEKVDADYFLSGSDDTVETFLFGLFFNI